MVIKVFDYGEGLERYTFFPYLSEECAPDEQGMYLGTCHTGLSVSMWGEINRHDVSFIRSVKEGQTTFIGKCVPFDSLPKPLRDHVLNRIKGG